MAKESPEALFTKDLISRLCRSDINSLIKNEQVGHLYFIYSWYINAVFVLPAAYRKAFNLDFLPNFDERLFNNIRVVIDNKPDAWKGFVSSIHDGLLGDRHLNVYAWEDLIEWPEPRDVDNYITAQHKINELADKGELLGSREELELWEKSFRELRQQYAGHISSDNKKKEQELLQNIFQTVSYKYKHSNLCRVLWGLCSYCLFKKRYDCIKYFWQFHSPPDSRSTNCGNDMVQRSIAEIIRFYFSRPLHNWVHRFWQDHHSEEPYYEKYFVLMLLTIVIQKQGLKTSIVNGEEKKMSIEDKYKAEIESGLQSFSRGQLLSITHEIHKYKDVADEIKQENDAWEVLFGISDGEKINGITEELKSFFELLRDLAEKKDNENLKESMLSPSKVEKFKKFFYSSYGSHTKISCIFERWKAREIRNDASGSEHIKQHTWIHSKEELIDDSVISGSNADWFGHTWANTDDYFQLLAIKERCVETDSSIEEILRSHDGEKILLLVGGDISEFEKAHDNFSYSWHDRREEIVGMIGNYRSEDKEFPVVHFRMEENNPYCMILTKNTAGKLFYFEKNAEAEKAAGVNIDVKEFKNIEDTKIKGEVPSWLKYENEGDDENPRTPEQMNAHLKEVVAIVLTSYWEWKPTEETSAPGYWLKIETKPS